MKKLFLASLLLLALVSCSTISDEEIIKNGSSLKGREAQEYYASSPVESARIEYNLAYSYLETKDFDKALQIALSSQEKYPEYIRFYTLEAYCMKMMGNREGYINSLIKILDKDPGYIAIHEMLLSAYIEEEEKDKIIECAKSLLMKDHKNELALNALAPYIPFYAELTGYDPSEKELENIMKDMDTRLKPYPEIKRNPQ